MRHSHRERLLEAAIECLERKGYARTTARDLAAAAEANLASIGYHYGSKERLLNTALTEAFRRWIEPLLVDVPVRSADDLRWLLIRGLTSFMQSLHRDRAMIVLFFESLAQSERNAELREEMARGYEMLRRRLAARVLEAKLADSERRARAVASSFVALFDGLMVQWLLDPDSVPSADQAVDALEAWLSADSGAQQ